MVIFHNDYSIPHAFYCHDLNACEVLINSEEDGGNKLLNAVLFVLHLLINIAFIFFPKIKAALGVASSLIDVGTELIPQSIENVSKLSIKFFFNPYCRKSVENIELINNRTLKSNSKEYKNLLVFARKIKFEVNKLIPKNAQTINYNINVNQGAGASHFQYSNQDAGKATISYNDQQLNVDQGTAGAHYVHVDKNSITAVSYSEPSQHIEQEYVPQKGYQDLHTTSSWEKFQRKQQEKDEKSQSNNPWNQGF